jgi:hypothetical protein
VKRSSVNETRVEHALEFNELAGSPIKGYPKLYFDADCTEEDNELKYCHILIQYWGHLEFEVKYSNSLIITTDKNKLSLSCEPDHVRKSSFDDKLFIEFARYEITLPQLNEIANAKRVDVKLKGKYRDCERHFQKENFESLKMFIDQCQAKQKENTP